MKKFFTALGRDPDREPSPNMTQRHGAQFGYLVRSWWCDHFQQDLSNADCIVIQGSNMAECHPVGFQWVMEAKARGARVIHIDPRFTRTSAVADTYVPIRRAAISRSWAGSSITSSENEKYFADYVVPYTNAATLVSEDFRDVDDLGGLFSGLRPDERDL